MRHVRRRIPALILLLPWSWFQPGVIAEAPRYSKGPSTSPETFPLAVWLQSPANAVRYRDLGINTYVALWGGANKEKLDALDKAGIRLICNQNRSALQFKDRPTIIGWMHGDEPDNAQSLPNGKGYGPPIVPEKIVEGYRKIREADPDRPVLLNLGQGVAWDGWYGRGVRTNHPEDYPKYLEGCDLASFDIYPASHDRKEIAGNLWYVPLGVDRLRSWTGGKRDTWCCIETTRIHNVHRKPTPDEVRSEVWMALIHGAKGIIYFAHEFKPKFIEAGLLADEEMAKSVAALNRQILELAPVLNASVPEAHQSATVASSVESVPVDHLVKRSNGATYVFAVAMRDGATKAKFTLAEKEKGSVEAIGENRSIDVEEGVWEDDFKGYQVHLYKFKPTKIK